MEDHAGCRDDYEAGGSSAPTPEPHGTAAAAVREEEPQKSMGCFRSSEASSGGGIDAVRHPGMDTTARQSLAQARDFDPVPSLPTRLV